MKEKGNNGVESHSQVIKLGADIPAQLLIKNGVIYLQFSNSSVAWHNMKL